MTMPFLDLTVFIIEHEEEILERIPPEQSVEFILAIGKMKRGLRKIALAIYRMKVP